MTELLACLKGLIISILSLNQDKKPPASSYCQGSNLVLVEFCGFSPKTPQGHEILRFFIVDYQNSVFMLPMLLRPFNKCCYEGDYLLLDANVKALAKRRRKYVFSVHIHVSSLSFLKQ